MKVYFRYCVFIILVMISYPIIAQDPPPPPDGGGGPGGVNDVPINFLIYPFLVLGAYLGFRFRDRFSK